MKTWATANPKGGVGKSSTWVPLAIDFAERGLVPCSPLWKIKKTGILKAVTEIRTLADYLDNKMESN
jgi:cellulose biosynthesis protein BcsQ